MHELSIAQSILDIIQQHVEQKDWERVRTVHLKIGTMAGVVPDSLVFSFQVITAETPLKQAQLAIESIPFRIQCNACKEVTESEYAFVQCSKCGSTDTTVLSGSELNVAEIEIAEPDEGPP